MFNKVIMIGNLSRDIEMKYTQGGLAIAKSSIATNRKFKSQQGEQKEEVCFIDITLFGRSAEVANQYLRKGSKIMIEGRLVFEQWNDQNGQKRSKHTVTVDQMSMLDSKSGSQDTVLQPQGQQQNQPTKSNIPSIDVDEDVMKEIDELDDYPF